MAKPSSCWDFEYQGDKIVRVYKLNIGCVGALLAETRTKSFEIATLPAIRSGKVCKQ